MKLSRMLSALTLALSLVWTLQNTQVFGAGCLITYVPGFVGTLERPKAIDLLMRSLHRLEVSSNRLESLSPTDISWLRRNEPRLAKLTEHDALMHYANQKRSLLFLIDKKLRVLIAAEAADRIWEKSEFQTGLVALLEAARTEVANPECKLNYTKDQLFAQMVRGMDLSRVGDKRFDWSNQRGIDRALVLAEVAVKAQIHQYILATQIKPLEINKNEASDALNRLTSEGLKSNSNDEYRAQYRKLYQASNDANNAYLKANHEEQQRFWYSINTLNGKNADLDLHGSIETRAEAEKLSCCGMSCGSCPVNRYTLVASARVDSSLTEKTTSTYNSEQIPENLALFRIWKDLEAAFPGVEWRIHEKTYETMWPIALRRARSSR